ncbi:cell division protein ZipA [Alteromonas flava]|uniref:cell division protein ZipA n=1 Tax=Alteromonas flava TaxID=2048003 RepID=UPI000C2812B7|nr:cell division protein ZipA [Alteromonas flava]
MEDLRFALLIVGGCAILAILAHGLWSLRKGNSKPTVKPRVEPSEPRDRVEGFDEFGLGEVRVVSQSKRSQDHSTKQAAQVEHEPIVDEDMRRADTEEVDVSEVEHPVIAQHLESDIPSLADVVDVPRESDAGAKQQTLAAETVEKPKKLYASVVSNPKPTMFKNEDRKEASVTPIPNKSIPEPPSFLLQEDDLSVESPTESADSEVLTSSTETTSDSEVEAFSLDQTPSDPHLNVTTEAAEPSTSTVEESKRAAPKRRSKSMFRKRIEPTLGEDQMRMSFDDEQKIEATQSVESSSPAPEQEVLVLNVRAPQGEEIPGAALLPMLLTLGFKFGDQDIFHRHVNSNGKGPVLFSLANMFKPGVFDIDNLENFTTQGVSLFMILPIEGDPHQVFNMMHNAARKLADEFAGQILDGRRSVLTKQGLQQYVEKIREFERRRMIARS